MGKRMDIKSFGANKGGSDEWYTPKEAVEVLLPYLKNNSKILCPFDKETSEYVRVLKEEGHTVVYSHIHDGQDFFNLEKPDVDYVISNPPYTMRTAVLKKLYEWDIPFALLLNGVGLFDAYERFELARKGVEVMYIYPRVKYIDHKGQRASALFQSVYWCHGILPKQMVFEVLKHE